MAELISASSASSSHIVSGSHNLDGEVIDIRTTVPTLGDGGENSVLMEVIHEVDLSREEAEHFVQRVERQLKMLRSLIYTNIARFQEWIVNLEDKTWLRARVTYAGCEGGKVMDYLSANVNADRQRLILGVSRGLSYLHSNDVVHGNLNPNNVHIGHDVGDEDPIPRISGFGFSYAMRDEPVHLKVEGAFSVSLRYVAPEILAGDGVPCDRQGDVWSLGSTLSQILLGKHPYESIRNEYYLLFAAVDPYEWDSSGPCHEMLQKCLARDPSLRPALSEVVESFESLFISRPKLKFSRLAVAPSGTKRKLLEVGTDPMAPIGLPSEPPDEGTKRKLLKVGERNPTGTMPSDPKPRRIPIGFKPQPSEPPDDRSQVSTGILQDDATKQQTSFRDKLLWLLPESSSPSPAPGRRNQSSASQSKHSMSITSVQTSPNDSRLSLSPLTTDFSRVMGNAFATGDDDLSVHLEQEPGSSVLATSLVPAESVPRGSDGDLKETIIGATKRLLRTAAVDLKIVPIANLHQIPNNLLTSIQILENVSRNAEELDQLCTVIQKAQESMFEPLRKWTEKIPPELKTLVQEFHMALQT